MSSYGISNPRDPVLETIGNNTNQVKETFEDVQKTLGNYDDLLMNVLTQHEEDFLYAYKQHMLKIERELQFLKMKANEQDAKLTQDVKIISL